MDFNSLLRLNFWPASLKLALHVTPDLSRLPIELVHLDFGGFLELIQSEFTLNDCCFEHKELELCKGRESLVSSPACLYFNSCKDWSIWSFVFITWVADGLTDLCPVRDA